MASPPSTLQVKVSPAKKKSSILRSLPFPLTFTFPPSPPPTVRDVKLAIAKAHPSLYTERQKISLPENSKALPDESSILFGSGGDVEVLVGDLGPQISWTTVFLVEYAGPLIIHPLIYHLPTLFYGKAVQHSALQKSVYAMVLLHFLKREFETLFVHRFSHATMPFRNIFKNSAHYHLLSGLLLAYDIYRPGFSEPSVAGTWRDNSTLLTGAWGVWAFAELSNLSTHLTVRNLRPAGTTTRAVPMGYGFSAPFNLAFPNYFFEIMGWTVVCAMSGSLAAGLFLVVSTVQMIVWAQKKHAAYKREFGDKYPRGRKAIFPGIL
ncbi:3-oxo-5-alpha-steroid 4-dehydrogenase-domain-containing protein [Roridomyces roridus]|uniref:3-oxo-5-alpha-steroid 4-dehydrogenase-domain-containing protein n=1 Tax=Roridomyces roridus TaxID=1738132 RepID=A0AAD7C9F5_9AGAR|nr:3-oxo-5-alpha-steroid 4-dehydrogenase-domain-containing protein [Roridomyces roridus]